LIIYDDIVSEEFGNLIDDILLAVTCIKYFWTGQISEEKLFGNCVLIVRFDATGSHPRVAPIFNALLEKIIYVTLCLFDSCLSRSMSFPTLLHDVPVGNTLS
jgi:hypothetical protein